MKVLIKLCGERAVKFCARLFQKAARIQRRGALVARRNARNSFVGIFFLPSFFFCASCRQKKKRVSSFAMSPATYQNFKLHFFLCQPEAQRKKFAKKKRRDDFALCGGRPRLRALDGRRPVAAPNNRCSRGANTFPDRAVRRNLILQDKNTYIKEI